ncbi:Orange carotenoid protein [Leptolyngbya sp. FACHB-261]|nr:Orange carotenoid protein [Leptolyngbya sp. FACHB-261]
MASEKIDSSARAVEAFQQLDVDTQLALLWFIYTQVRGPVHPSSPSVASPEVADGLIEQIRQMPEAQQLEAQREIVGRVDTPISREYGALSANTKLTFWHHLAQEIDQGKLIAFPDNYKLKPEAQNLMAAIQSLDYGLQIQALRDAVVSMGSDPQAVSKLIDPQPSQPL